MWMGPDELSKRVEAAVVGIMADSKKAESERGRSAAAVGGAVLSAVRKEGGVEELCAVTMVGGVQCEKSSEGREWTSGRPSYPGDSTQTNFTTLCPEGREWTSGRPSCPGVSTANDYYENAKRNRGRKPCGMRRRNAGSWPSTTNSPTRQNTTSCA